MKFPTCFALSNLVLALWDAAADPGSRTLFDAVWRARRAGGDAGVVDGGGRGRVRGDGHGPGVPVPADPVDPGEDDGHGFGHGLALILGDF